jgi:hypothetical protein
MPVSVALLPQSAIRDPQTATRDRDRDAGAGDTKQAHVARSATIERLLRIADRRSRIAVCGFPVCGLLPACEKVYPP